MSTLIWKRRLAKLYAPFCSGLNRRIILLYHSVGDGSLAISKDMFRQQMNWLAERASIVPVNDLISENNNHGLQAAVTFDDGYVSLYEHAAPILEELGRVATVYLNTGWIGETERKASVAELGHYDGEQFLTWNEVEALRQAGWNIGSHGVNHLDMTIQDANLVEEELVNSKREIETRLGQPCEYFAYTWGRFSPELQSAVKTAGYHSAASGLHGPVTPASDPFAVPRIDVRAEYELSDFQNLVEGYWDFLGFKQRLMRKLA